VWIDRLAAEADRAGMRYWAMIQAFGDPRHRLLDGVRRCERHVAHRAGAASDAAELHEEFRHSRATRMEGYVVFASHWPSGSPSMWLANHLELEDQLVIENGS
jgi:hypothetical protein